VSAYSSAISDAATQMAPNSWRPLTTQGLEADMVISGDKGSYIYGFSNDAIWHEETGQLLYIGAPHYMPMKFNVYTAATNTWRAEALPPCQSSLGWVSHSYDNLAIDTDRGHMYHLYRGTLYRFDVAANQWGAPLPGLGDSRYGSLEYFPEMNGLIYVLKGTISFFNLDTKKWSTIKTGVAMGGYHNLAQYSPVYRKMLLGGGNGNNSLHLMDSQGNLKRISTPPVAVGINAALMTLEPVSGNFLVMTEESVYIYYVESDRWETLNKSFFAEVSFAVVAPITSHGVVAVISNTQWPVLLYKYADSHTPIRPRITLSNGPVVNVSPNPFSSSTMISLNNMSGPGTIQPRIFDITGRLVKTLKPEKNPYQFRFDAKGLEAGVYILRVTREKRTFSKVLIVH
jgi:hypothetical protein